ncbi:MAG: hypothetical protein JW963_06145 [Anaerolineales bacterium]|nr:hypothetical protein [Anaerolineales bacterium]
MIKNRLSNAFIVVILILMVLFTIYGSLETNKVVFAAEHSNEPAYWSDAPECIWSEADRASIRSVYLEDIGISLPRTDSGYTGYDGGLIYLLSEYRSCQAGEEK